VCVVQDSENAHNNLKLHSANEMRFEDLLASYMAS
jgi:hypothetical protein